MAASRKTIVEDEDLDDLDDVLERFNDPPKVVVPGTLRSSEPPAPPPPTKEPSTSATSPVTQQRTTDPFNFDGLDDDFARELTKGMESLFRDIAQGAGLDDVPQPGKEPDSAAAEGRDKAFRAAWEAMLVEGMNGVMTAEDVAVGGGKGNPAAGPTSASETGTAQGTGGGVDSFQENIKKAMEKLKESDRMADEASAKGSESLDDIFSRIQGDLDSTDSEEDLKGILESMMSQLMSKDVLYEPLKELHDKFPSYLEDNASTLSAEDKTRYNAQSKVVAQIVAVFEDPTYADDDPQKGLKVVELMQEMQEHGSPPAEIMGPLPPGFDTGADGLPKLPEGCTIS